MSNRIVLTHQGYWTDGTIIQNEGWIARCDGFACWGRTRKAAYMRAYRHRAKYGALNKAIDMRINALLLEHGIKEPTK